MCMLARRGKERIHGSVPTPGDEEYDEVQVNLSVVHILSIQNTLLHKVHAEHKLF